ncbi:MAG: DUF3034 family protein [Desulfobacteraceae bacterium]|nr:DUF3034 family protein [Desulfobacteraceae bacterium]
MAEEAKKGPPLPLIGIEGYGGVALTYSAYLVNPASPGMVLGRPSMEVGAVGSPSGRWVTFGMITENIGGRLEIGYGFDAIDLHNLPGKVYKETGMSISDSATYLHNFNARLMLVKEGEFNLSWLPALTFGVHYKYNPNVKDIDSDLAGTLTAIGIEDNQGYEFTLYASKMLKCFPRPVLINVGCRNSDAAHIGFLGFTGTREFLAEGNVLFFITDRLLVGAEYRMKPNAYKAIPGLVNGEDDWFSFVAAYVVNERFTIAGGVFNFGEVLNHVDDGALGLKFKYEF